MTQQGKIRLLLADDQEVLRSFCCGSPRADLRAVGLV